MFLKVPHIIEQNVACSDQFTICHVLDRTKTTWDHPSLLSLALINNFLASQVSQPCLTQLIFFLNSHTTFSLVKLYLHFFFHFIVPWQALHKSLIILTIPAFVIHKCNSISTMSLFKSLGSSQRTETCKNTSRDPCLGWYLSSKAHSFFLIIQKCLLSSY